MSLRDSRQPPLAPDRRFGGFLRGGLLGAGRLSGHPLRLRALHGRRVDYAVALALVVVVVVVRVDGEQGAFLLGAVAVAVT